MKRIILVTLLCMPMLASAQFFDFNFGFDDPFFTPRKERKQEVVVKPEFKGGKEALEKYLKKNFKNPVDIQGVTGPQHGSFMRLTKKEYKRLKKWSDKNRR